MSDNALEVTRTNQFQLAVEHELNQVPGKLYPLAGSSAMYSDKGAQLVDRFDHVNLEEKTTRNGDTNVGTIDVARRWIKKPRSFNKAIMIDREDMKTTRVDIRSPIAESMSLAVRRYHDDQFLSGYFGNAYTGEDGDTAVPFDSNNVIDPGTDFTKAALLELREAMILKDVDVDAEMPILFIDPLSETKLLGIEEYVNKDYTADGRPPLVRGEIKDWLGFRFIRCNLTSSGGYPRGSGLVVPSANHVALPAFVPSGVHRGVWTEAFGKVEEMPNKSYSWQIFAEACSAVTRLNEDKCFQLVVDHTPA